MSIPTQRRRGEQVVGMSDLVDMPALVMAWDRLATSRDQEAWYAVRLGGGVGAAGGVNAQRGTGRCYQ